MIAVSRDKRERKRKELLKSYPQNIIQKSA